MHPYPLFIHPPDPPEGKKNLAFFFSYIPRHNESIDRNTGVVFTLIAAPRSMYPTPLSSTAYGHLL